MACYAIALTNSNWQVLGCEDEEREEEVLDVRYHRVWVQEFRERGCIAYVYLVDRDALARTTVNYQFVNYRFLSSAVLSVQKIYARTCNCPNGVHSLCIITQACRLKTRPATKICTK